MHATISGHAPSCSRDLFDAPLVTPARLAALCLSLVVLLAAVWVVFVGFPNNPAPPPTNVAVLPSQLAAGATALPGPSPSSAPTSSTGGQPSAEPTPGNPLLKE